MSQQLSAAMWVAEKAAVAPKTDFEHLSRACQRRYRNIWRRAEVQGCKEYRNIAEHAELGLCVSGTGLVTSRQRQTTSIHLLSVSI